MAKRKQKEPTPEQKEPTPEQKDHFRELVRNCIAAYSQLLNDSLALDFNKVTGTMRALVVDDEEYRQETRSIRAKRMLDEIRETEELAKMAQGVIDLDDEDADTPIDPRDRGKRRKGATGADKDVLSMRFKAALMRRDLLNLSAENNVQEETNALNVFFVTTTRAEFDKLKLVEISHGTSEGAEALAAEAVKTAPNVRKKLAASLDDEPYVIEEDGTIREVS